MAAATAPSQVRPRREREEELLVWPDLVFVEFICAVLFTFTFTIMSALVNAPLINRANPDVTPNPSKAPWYFLNLQELLLHMDPALAGVIVPTIFLIVLAAVPYIDRAKEGQGEWFGTPNAVRISVFSGLFALIGTVGLIVFDAGKHALAWESITGRAWPFGADRPDWLPNVGFIHAVWDLAFIRDVRSIQTAWEWRTDLGGLVPLLRGNDDDRYLTWPESFESIPVPLNGTSFPRWGNAEGEPPPGWFQDLPNWLTGPLPYDAQINLPAVLVEILIPSFFMIALPALLLYILWRIGWLVTRRDVMLSLFTGFIVAYWVMTIVGSAFRGAGQELVLPWDVPHID